METTTEQIKAIFSDLKQKAITENEAEEKILALFNDVKIDTTDIVLFAAKHQKEYGKDISFAISKEDDTIIATLQTVFGKFTGKGTNQKIAKKHAVKKANEAWEN